FFKNTRGVVKELRAVDQVSKSDGASGVVAVLEPKSHERDSDSFAGADDSLLVTFEQELHGCVVSCAIEGIALLQRQLRQHRRKLVLKFLLRTEEKTQRRLDRQRRNESHIAKLVADVRIDRVAAGFRCGAVARREAGRDEHQHAAGGQQATLAAAKDFPAPVLES